ncbi:MAG: hypothetical protein LH614_12750 [Pyrinomonadaceae bacterium]|nr:hypothetical protein [Pyrinomonadaceae bacterium]
MQGFFNSARAKEPQKQPTDANQIIRSVKFLIENQSGIQAVEVVEESGENLPLAVLDAEQIKQVLLNPAINARHAMANGGRLVFRTFQKDGNLLIETEDTAGGIDEATKAKIFDPFFSTKEKSLGLGFIGDL